MVCVIGNAVLSSSTLEMTRSTSLSKSLRAGFICVLSGARKGFAACAYLWFGMRGWIVYCLVVSVGIVYEIVELFYVVIVYCSDIVGSILVLRIISFCVVLKSELVSCSVVLGLLVSGVSVLMMGGVLYVMYVFDLFVYVLLIIIGLVEWLVMRW